MKQRSDRDADACERAAEADRVAGLYAIMSTAELKQLQGAFLLEVGGTDRAATIEFAGGRLALIAAELRKRGDG